MGEYYDILKIAIAMISQRDDCDEIIDRLREEVSRAIETVSSERGLPFSACFAVAADYMEWTLDKASREMEREYVQRKAN